MSWDFKNFSPDEFACRYSGEHGISLELVKALQGLRTRLGFPMKISSGYRSMEHPIEAKKLKGGVHTEGKAADVLCFGEQAYLILVNAVDFGFTGIGVNQKGSLEQRFIHLDISDKYGDRVRPYVWSY